MGTVTIKAMEVVKCIRAGMDDATLMDKFKVSSRGLQRLLSTLESAGILNKSELEERLALSYGTVIVDVDHATLELTSVKRPSIDALEARNFVRAGMDDRALMKQYNLSVKGLQSLLTKLVAAGAITSSDVTNRKISGQDSFVVDEDLAIHPAQGAMPTVDPRRVLDFINAGMDHQALSEHYRISSTDLDNVLKRLVREGLVDRAELKRLLPVTLRQFHITRSSSNEIIYTGDAPTFAAVVEQAVSSGIDLSEAQLGGVNLARSSLSGAQLSNANLRNAILTGADLTGARLCGAKLASADMSRAILYKTNFAKADLSEANLTMVYGVWAFMGGANLSEADLTRADFSGANFADACMFEAILNGTNFDGAYMERVN